MKNLIIFGFFVMALVFVQFAQAQTVDEVIDKYMAALGGKDKLLSLTSVYMEGVSVRQGNEINHKVYKVQDKLYRTDVDFGMGKFIIIATPDKGWQSNFRNGGALEPMTAEVLKGFSTEMDCQGPLVNYAAKGHKAELAGKEAVDSIDCFKIKLTSKTGKEIYYWIDAKTYLIHQSSQKVKGRGDTDIDLVTVYSDYKAVDGIQFAFTATAKGGAMGGGSINYEKIETNKPVDEKLYKPE
jgi:hypothetical protein